MQKTGIILGIVIGVVLLGGVIGASSAFDKLVGPSITDVTVERINSTHAAVSWTTDEPTYGYLKAYVSHQCGPAWGARMIINKINDSSLTRTHLVVASIYGLHGSPINATNVPKDKTLKWYSVEIWGLGKERSDGYTRTIVERNLSRTCQ